MVTKQHNLTAKICSLHMQTAKSYIMSEQQGNVFMYYAHQIQDRINLYLFFPCTNSSDFQIDPEAITIWSWWIFTNISNFMDLIQPWKNTWDHITRNVARDVHLELTPMTLIPYGPDAWKCELIDQLVTFQDLRNKFQYIPKGLLKLKLARLKLQYVKWDTRKC